MINFTKTALRNLFRKPATRNYPAVPREYPVRTRGSIGIDINTCIFCGLCSKKCPTSAIEVDRSAATWSIRRFGCIQCGACVEVCPKKCLVMQNAYTDPGAEKRVDLFTGTPVPVKPAPTVTQAPQPVQTPSDAPTDGSESK